MGFPELKKQQKLTKLHTNKLMLGLVKLINPKPIINEEIRGVVGEKGIFLWA